MVVGILDESGKNEVLQKCQFQTQLQPSGLCAVLSPGPPIPLSHVFNVENISAFLFECQFLTSAIS